ncbi:hypothetical protein BO85DRAFT_270120 [Aspergillus piperis CBS 112811]|uniref:Uncharacterized protein n=1 Tax=Aspergillus piperis CBS 112811 TaxID=1448313 RepID=A0A8G1R412_9EURO|nr:hypothetical protein BO85DRAFT_270120 [Aspergillus piperis CBS 112811]RAH58261.1 hypothetical protein BO85DRAFT_270120 [Aspergillus piperis CBS 112811]
MVDVVQPSTARALAQRYDSYDDYSLSLMPFFCLASYPVGPSWDRITWNFVQRLSLGAEAQTAFRLSIQVPHEPEDSACICTMQSPEQVHDRTNHHAASSVHTLVRRLPERTRPISAEQKVLQLLDWGSNVILMSRTVCITHHHFSGALWKYPVTLFTSALSKSSDLSGNGTLATST